MNVFFSHEQDLGFQAGQVISYGGKKYYVEGVRSTPSGVWLELDPLDY